jgi:hypothetical protein
MIKKRKKGDFSNIPTVVVVVETHWGIAGTTTPRTVVSAYTNMVS